MSAAAPQYARHPTGGPLDVGVLLAAAAAVLFSLARYYRYDATGTRKLQCGVICPLYNSAWHGVFGWLGVLLVVTGAIAVATVAWAPTVRLPIPARTIALASLGLGLLSTIAAYFVIPTGDYLGFPVPADAPGVVAGHGACYWLALASAAAALVMAALGQRQGSLAKLH